MSRRWRGGGGGSVLARAAGRLAAIINAGGSVEASLHTLEEAVVIIPRLALGDGVEQGPDRPAALRRPEDAGLEPDLGRDVADEDVPEISLLELLRLPRLVPDPYR